MVFNDQHLLPEHIRAVYSRYLQLYSDRLKRNENVRSSAVLINLAALFRVVMPLTFSAQQHVLFYLATLAWLGAFALFVVVYSPVLMRKRVDDL